LLLVIPFSSKKKKEKKIETSNECGGRKPGHYPKGKYAIEERYSFVLDRHVTQRTVFVWIALDRPRSHRQSYCCYHLASLYQPLPSYYTNLPLFGFSPPFHQTLTGA
jgi:hypothetical protein